VSRAVDQLATRAWRLLPAVAAVTVPLIVLPDAAAALRPTLTPVHYPGDWSVVARRVEGRGDVAVLPWGSYRTFEWAPGRSVLDPAPRLLPTSTVLDDRLAVSGHLLAGENRRAETVRRAIAAGSGLPAALARAGVRWVVVEHDTPGEAVDLRGLTLRFAGAGVSLYRVPGPVVSVRPSAGRIAAVAVADSLALAALIGLLAWWAAGRRRSRRPRRKTQPTAPTPLL
jgi:hypothetical protein